PQAPPGGSSYVPVSAPRPGFRAPMTSREVGSATVVRGVGGVARATDSAAGRPAPLPGRTGRWPILRTVGAPPAGVLACRRAPRRGGDRVSANRVGGHTGGDLAWEADPKLSVWSGSPGHFAGQASACPMRENLDRVLVHLPGRMRPMSLEIPTRDELYVRYVDRLPYEPYPVQDLALAAWFESEQGILVCAPTGTGKTLIAEAALFEALHTGKVAYYTTPLIALTEQKFQEMQDRAD